MSPRRLLVVGGTGFIGSRVVAHAVTLGWKVTSLSLRPAAPGSSGATSVVTSIADAERLKAALGDTAFDYVVNCGGYIDHTLFSHGGRKVFDAHFGGVLNLAGALNCSALQSFINIGSSDEYGDAPAPQREIQRESPISPYAAAKVAATHFLQMLWRTEQFPATTLRLFLTYGPGQDNRRFLPQVILGCMSGSAFGVSAGAQLRDFCYVDDTVRAIFLALNDPRARGEVLNIASGQPISIRDAIEAVRRIIGNGEPHYGGIPYRTGESMALYADVGAAERTIGWKPNVTFDAGLRRTIQAVRPGDC